MRLSAVIAAFASVVELAALEPEQVWERVSPSVMRVEAEMFDGDRTQGSGFVCEVGGRKWIFSNRHVVLGAKKVRVGQSETNLLEASGYRISAELDLAIIEPPTALVTPSLPKRTLEPKTGERIFAIGFPLGLNKSINQGIISSQTDKVVQFDAPISSGNSGGPLVDKDGQVIAIVTAGSTPGTDQVVQNLNFAIKVAVIPEIEVFRDPNLSFFDAWLELVKFENGLIDQIKDLRVLELRGYLISEWMSSSVSEQGKKLSSREQELFRDYQTTQLRSITDRHGTLERAEAAVSSFLKEQTKEFDRIPAMFLGVPNQPLMREFARDKRPGGLFRLNIEESEIVPLLRLSLEHSKGKYEDAAFQVDFLARYLVNLKNPEHPLAKNLQALLADLSDGKGEGVRRETRRLDYSRAELSNPEASARLFFQGMLPYSPSLRTALRPDEQKLKSNEHIERYGGLETEIASMFGRMGIDRLQHGDVEKAITLMGNEIAYRRQPDLRSFAHFNACAGKHEVAYSFYLKAFTDSIEAVEAFSLEMGGRTTRRLILGEIVEPADRFWSYPETLKANLSRWTAFLGSKPGSSMRSLPSLADAVTSREFTKLDELQRAMVIDSFYKESVLDQVKRSGFQKALESDPATYSFYRKYF